MNKPPALLPACKADSTQKASSSEGAFPLKSSHYFDIIQKDFERR